MKQLYVLSEKVGWGFEDHRTLEAGFWGGPHSSRLQYPNIVSLCFNQLKAWCSQSLCLHNDLFTSQTFLVSFNLDS